VTVTTLGQSPGVIAIPERDACAVGGRRQSRKEVYIGILVYTFEEITEG
jgi:hypothetical protein